MRKIERELLDEQDQFKTGFKIDCQNWSLNSFFCAELKLTLEICAATFYTKRESFDGPGSHLWSFPACLQVGKVSSLWRFCESPWTHKRSLAAKCIMTGCQFDTHVQGQDSLWIHSEFTIALTWFLSYFVLVIKGAWCSLQLFSYLNKIGRICEPTDIWQ